MEIVALDIGGTHARFVLAHVDCSKGAVRLVGDPVTLETSAYPNLQSAWAEYAHQLGRPLPDAAALAIAGPVTGAAVQMTNNSWIIEPGALDKQLGLSKVVVLNDFAAVAHAVATASAGEFVHLAGPDAPLPECGTVSVIGPGTGLGVAYFRRDGARYTVTATEGGHVDFAPIDQIDDGILVRLRQRHRRVSVERVVSGPGIVDIRAALAALERQSITDADDRTIWEQALAGSDPLAVAAMERFCLSLGSVAGDYALAHGASAVVIAGGLGYRLRDVLRASGFAQRFCAKGRYERMMAGLPVKLITHPQPGLLGAAAAFAMEHC
ncbi:MAG: glucokinase [Novosphingobium sp.]